MRLVVTLALLLAAPVAHAGPDDAVFARSLDVRADQVSDVRRHVLPSGGHYTHVLVGRYVYREYVMGAVVLQRCVAGDCQGRKVTVGATDQVDVLGLVDLEGKPTPIPASRVLGDVRGTGKERFPVLAVRSTESREGTARLKSRREVTGKETRARLYLISLVEADRASVVLQDTSLDRDAAGAGMSRGYRLEPPAADPAKPAKGKPAPGPLELVATEQRELPRDSRCLRPKPVELRFALDGRHFRQITTPERTGC